MTKGLRSVGKEFITFALILIAISALAAGIFWFVGHVLAGYAIAYLSAWKWIYLVPTALLAVFEILRMLAMVVMINRLVGFYQVSSGDIGEAIVDFKLTKEPGYLQWNPTEFKNWLGAKRAARSMGRTLASAIMGGHRR